MSQLSADEKMHQFMANIDRMKTPYIYILVPFLTTISITGKRRRKKNKGREEEGEEEKEKEKEKEEEEEEEEVQEVYEGKEEDQ